MKNLYSREVQFIKMTSCQYGIYTNSNARSFNQQLGMAAPVFPKNFPLQRQLIEGRPSDVSWSEQVKSDGLQETQIDRLNRPLRDLRISVTDRCNFRCSYCMPKDVFHKGYPYLSHAELLSFEEIIRITRSFVALGVSKIRITGGEPLLRKDIEVLISQLAALRTPENLPLDLSLTTNGSLLSRKAKALKAAGLKRLTVSLDGLDDKVFRAMNNVEFPVENVLSGIEAAHAAGFQVVKVNMVVKRNFNDDQILPMARHFRGTGVVLRFIEYMDAGNTNGWRMDEVFPSSEIISLIQSVFPLVKLNANSSGETAQRWGYATKNGRHDKDAGEFGVISSITDAFCESCTRARLSTEGKLYLCLFAQNGFDLRKIVRNDINDQDLKLAIGKIWSTRGNQYAAQRGIANQSELKRIEMSYIGG